MVSASTSNPNPIDYIQEDKDRARIIFKKGYTSLGSSSQIFEHVHLAICGRIGYGVQHSPYPLEYPEDTSIAQDVSKFLEYMNRNIIHLSDLNINAENALRYFFITKSYDLLSKELRPFNYTNVELPSRSTYSIRTLCLKLLSPKITTTDAYTYSLNPVELANADYLKNPSNWIPERIKFYEQSVVPVTRFRIEELSPFFKWPVTLLRGCTASGKTSFIQKLYPDVYEQVISGTINPDLSKSIIKTKTCSNFILTNKQVHKEVTKGPLSDYKDKFIHDPKYNIIVDSRLTFPEELDDAIQAASKKKDGRMRIIDLDASLFTIFVRVLGTRSPKGTDPCVDPDEIIQNFRNIRASRLAIIKKVREEALVEKYKLYHEGRSKPVAEKKHGFFIIHNQDLYESLCKLPSDKEIKDELNQIISRELINKIPRKKILDPYRCLTLEPWKGFTLEKALKYHSEGISLKDAKVQEELEKSLLDWYGPTVTMDLSNNWFLDCPKVYEHIKTEQLLHIRGNDKTGRGLTWQTNKFAWSLNREYNPENHIQMRLGFFRIPKSQLELFNAKIRLPEDIHQDLLDGDYYRFFVHPEAYQHFLPLHLAGIPFTKPEESEFMGTPTSSYRSWAIRRVKKVGDKFVHKENSRPFIIKFGVGSGSNPSKLLSRKEIATSIMNQDALDQVEENKDNPLYFFSERLGLVPKNISNYPTQEGIIRISSGNIIREFPELLLKGDGMILSLSAVMSPNRIDYPGVARASDQAESTDTLPLIYSMMDSAITKPNGFTSPYEYIKHYFIDRLMTSLEGVIFQHALSLPLHGQNLCVVLDNNNLPIGFALRDFSDIQKAHRYVETHTWFYRYHIFIKLLNVITCSDQKYLDPIRGAPKQLGMKEPAAERSVYQYLYKKNKRTPHIQQTIKQFSITLEERNNLLDALDHSYYAILKKYFHVKDEDFLTPEGCLPSIEVDSSSPGLKINHDLYYWKRNVVHAAPSSLSIAELLRFSWCFDHGMLYRCDYSSGKIRTLEGCKKAIRLRTMAAEKGNIRAQYELGWTYLHGKAPTETVLEQDFIPSELRNLQEAIKWLRCAGLRDRSELLSNWECSEALRNLALCYFHGLEVKPDHSEAQKLCDKMLMPTDLSELSKVDVSDLREMEQDSILSPVGTSETLIEDIAEVNEVDSVDDIKEDVQPTSNLDKGVRLMETLSPHLHLAVPIIATIPSALSSCSIQ